MSADTQAWTDPDTSLSRLRRAFNQYDQEESFFQQASGCSMDERFALARLAIFRDFDDVWGREVIERVAPVSIPNWPDKDLVTDTLWPAFSITIDKLEKTLRTLPKNCTDQAALRLSVLVYFFGILLHPAIDGNGQTFRLIALSYVRQYSRRYRRALFPLKYIQDYGASLHIHPVTETMVRNTLETGSMEQENVTEASVKETILATLLTTRKGFAFIRHYIHGTSFPQKALQDEHEKTALIFQSVFDSLEQDFRVCFEKESPERHARKHTYIQTLFPQETLSLQKEFALTPIEAERITEALKSIDAE